MEGCEDLHREIKNFVGDWNVEWGLFFVCFLGMCLRRFS